MYKLFYLFVVNVFLLMAVVTGVCRAQERSAWETAVPMDSELHLKGKDVNTVFTRYQSRFLGGDREWVWIGGDKGYLAYTSDGGNKWREVNLGTDAPVRDIYFRDETGYLLAGNSLYRSDADGIRWSHIYTFSSKDNATPVLYGMAFSSQNNGCIVGVYARKRSVVDHLIMCTGDGGTSWNPRNAQGKEELLYLDFVDGQNGWAVGVGGILLRTSNGGVTWQRLPFPTKATLFHVKFISSLRGWVVGAGAAIFYTSDGGQTWQPVTPTGVKKNIRLLDINFLDDGRGWIIGHNGTILYNKDGGANWELQLSGTTQNLYALSMDSQNKKHAWAVGGGGTILRYNLK
jgi:photosystem II stability/assembly factor-like uncharacterized protein